MFDYFKKEVPEKLLHYTLKVREKRVFQENLSYENTPYFVLERVQSRNTRKAILHELVRMDYDFESPFPYESLLEQFPVLQKVRDNLQKEDNFYRFYEKKGKKGFTPEGLRYLLVRTPVNLSEYAFRRGYDLYINYGRDESCVLILHPALKKDYSLVPYYIKFSRKEKDAWVLWKGESVLKTSQTKMKKEELEQFVKTFQLKK